MRNHLRARARKALTPSGIRSPCRNWERIRQPSTQHRWGPSTQRTRTASARSRTIFLHHSSGAMSTSKTAHRQLSSTLCCMRTTLRMAMPCFGSITPSRFCGGRCSRLALAPSGWLACASPPPKSLWPSFHAPPPSCTRTAYACSRTTSLSLPMPPRLPATVATQRAIRPLATMPLLAAAATATARARPRPLRPRLT